MRKKISPKSPTEFIAGLAGRGIYHFTIEQFAQERGSSLVAARAALRRMSKHGEIAAPLRSFLVIVPPEYRSLGCLPAEQFIPQLMDHLEEPYYVALLSAAAYHGAAHHAAQSFQVMLTKNRSSISCGRVKVDFFAKYEITDTPTLNINTPRGRIKISSPEATAFDLVGYQHQCGGLDHVATLLSELSEKINSPKLVELASSVPMPWVQRLGYLLHLVGADKKAKVLAKYIDQIDPKVTPLLPGSPIRKSIKDRVFRVAINTEVEPDV